MRVCFFLLRGVYMICNAEYLRIQLSQNKHHLTDYGKISFILCCVAAGNAVQMCDSVYIFQIVMHIFLTLNSPTKAGLRIGSGLLFHRHSWNDFIRDNIANRNGTVACNTTPNTWNTFTMTTVVHSCVQMVNRNMKSYNDLMLYSTTWIFVHGNI